MKAPSLAPAANLVGPCVAAAVALLVVVLTASGLGLSGVAASDGDPDANAHTVVMQLRIWQHVEEAEELWISARPAGGRWATLGTIPLPESGYGAGHSETSRHRYGVLTVAGVGLRVWQRETEPASIYVEVCPDTCRRWAPTVRLRWWPLGKNPLPLDDGLSRSGRYRYGDLTVAAPRGNPDLLADREHLLALRDVFEGGGTELDWSVGTPATEWQGVTVGGTPPRVTGLDLRELGLAGEIWGYVGDLPELADLRLDGNALTGTIPSKLVTLEKLTRLRVGGNALEGCVPPPLRRIADHDLDETGLPDCADPPWVWSHMTALTYYIIPHGPFGDMGLTDPPWRIVFDVPGGRTLRDVRRGIAGPGLAHYNSDAATIFDSYARGVSLHDADDAGTWLFLGIDYRDIRGFSFRGGERERSHYAGCVYDCGKEKSRPALLEQVAASVWINRTPLAHFHDYKAGPDKWWVWP